MVLLLSQAPKSGTVRTLRNGESELIGFGASLFVANASFPSCFYPSGVRLRSDRNSCAVYYRNAGFPQTYGEFRNG
jgi:hypothetical protein